MNVFKLIEDHGLNLHGDIEHFAELVRADEREQIIEKNKPEIEKVNAYIKDLEQAVLAEREACEKLCEKEAQEAYHQEAFYLPQGNPGLLRIAEGAKRCADAIRARGGEK
jgi:hypothetical protein